MRSLAIYLLLGLFSVVLSVAIVLRVVNVTIGNGDTVKSWITDAQLGPAIASELPNFVSDFDIPQELKDKAGEQLESPLGEQLLQPALTSAVDQIYDWLNAEQFKVPQIELDLSTNSQPAIDAISKLITENYEELPLCDSKNDVICNINSNPNKVKDDIIANLSQKDGLLSKIELTPSSSDIEAVESLTSVYNVYHSLKYALPSLVTICIIIAGFVILLSHRRLEGVVTVFRTITFTTFCHFC